MFIQATVDLTACDKIRHFPFTYLNSLSIDEIGTLQPVLLSSVLIELMSNFFLQAKDMSGNHDSNTSMLIDSSKRGVTYFQLKL